MLRVEDRTSRAPLFSKNLKPVDKATTPEIRYDVAPSVQLIARDSFVAETSNKIEQLQASIRLMSRDLSHLANSVTDLQQNAAQEHRWQNFDAAEKRNRQDKLEEALRNCRELKARIDRIEARGNGNYHAYTSFEAVSRKLTELEDYKEEAHRVERSLTLRAWLLCGSMGLAAMVLVLANAIMT